VAVNRPAGTKGEGDWPAGTCSQKFGTTVATVASPTRQVSANPGCGSAAGE
jgi:hypothetical protein